MEKAEKYLVVLVLLAALLRFFKLGSNPPSLYWDEVSLGYNAYSILKTGQDEFAARFPVDKFIAFGDYKPVGYIYATVPSIALFGLNEFAVRFPSALSGVLMVVLTYFLTKKLFNNKKLSLLSAFLLAVSPWSLHLSRAAFESNLAAFLNLLAVFFFVKGVKNKGYFLLFSVASFIGAFYTFNSNRVLLPIFILSLTAVYFKELLKRKKWYFISLFLGFLLLLPLLPYLRSRESRLRYHEVNIFSDLNVVIRSNERIQLDGRTVLAKVIHHRYIGHALNFLGHYFDHFNVEFLFVSGDVNPRLSVRSVGQLYLIELPFFLIGLYFIFLNLKKKSYLLILVWFLVAPLPAAIARETPHALRILSILPAPQIISALGIYNFLSAIKNYPQKIKNSLFFILYSLFFINFGYYLYSYYLVSPKIYSFAWLDGYKQAVEYAKDIKKDYGKIYITDFYGRPYIYFLFYQKYSPQAYFEQVERTRDWFGNWTVHSFDKFEFTDKIPEEQGRILYFASPDKTLSGFVEIGKIKRNNGETAFLLLEKG